MDFDRVCSCLAVLADPIRLRMLLLLHRQGELCVCELTHALAIPQPRASKHLATLRDVGVVRMRRDAQWVLYAIAEDAGAWLNNVLPATARELADDAVIAGDSARLASMCGRPDRCRVA